MDVGLAISGGFAALSNAVEITKFLRSVDMSVDEAETKRKLADLSLAMSDLKLALAEIKIQVADKDSLIHKLQSQAAVEANTVWEKPFYFIVKEDSKDGPFCQTCKDKEGKFIRLQQSLTASERFDCLSCSGIFRTHYVKREIPRSSGGSWMS